MPPKAKRLGTSVEQRGPSVSTRISLTDPTTGQRIQRRITAPDIESLEAEVARVRAAHRAGERITPDRTPLGEWLKAWLESTRRGTESTQHRYLSNVRLYITPRAIGSVPLGRVTPLHVQTWIDELDRDKYSAHTITVAYGTLNQGLRRAHRLGIISRNPCDGVQLPKRDAPAWTILDDEQAARLIDGTRGDRYHAMWTLAVMLGLRNGELAALKWSDIDFEAATITVQRTVTRGRDGLLYIGTSAKSGASRRTIPLPARCVAALRECRAMQNERRLALGSGWLRDDAVFDKGAGQHWTNTTGLWVQFRAATDRLGLPQLRRHDLRHTAISAMLRAGIPITVVAAIAGHANASITLSTYSHVIAGMVTEARDVLDTLYRPKERKTGAS